METKYCNLCKSQLPISQFYKRKGYENRYYTYCRSCTNEKKKIYDKNNPEKYKERKKRYIKNHPDKEREKNRRYRHKYPEKVRKKKRDERTRLIRSYIVKLLLHEGYSRDIIEENPKLIEAKRELLKIKRLIRNKNLNEYEKAN